MIYELNANGMTVNGKPAVEIHAYFMDGKDHEHKMTACYSGIGGSDDVICVYDGDVNVEDPGEGPYEEYSDRGDALKGDFSKIFAVLFDLADGMMRVYDD